jgi:predicted lipoprotein with Yx(FWY)xxD motif
MTRTPKLLAGAATAALGLAGLAGIANAGPTAGAAGARTVVVRHTAVGNILATTSGFTLYEFTRDHTNRDSCQNVAGCTEAWPPLLTSGAPHAGHGVNGRLLGTIKLKNGKRQVTYAGHALYLYSADSPGETSYVGVSAFGGRWYGVNARGAAVR